MTKTSLTALFFGISAVTLPDVVQAKDPLADILGEEFNLIVSQYPPKTRSIVEMGANFIRYDCTIGMDLKPNEGDAFKPIEASIIPMDKDTLKGFWHTFQKVGGKGLEWRHFLMVDPNGNVYPVDKKNPLEALDKFLEASPDAKGPDGITRPLGEQLEKAKKQMEICLNFS